MQVKSGEAPPHSKTLSDGENCPSERAFKMRWGWDAPSSASARCSAFLFMRLRSSTDKMDAKHYELTERLFHFGCSRNKWLVSASNFVTPSAAVAS